MQMIEMKLKPCPFCGSENVRFKGGEHAVVCARCKARGAIAPNEDMALDMWNDRLYQPKPAPRAVRVGEVSAFPGAKPDKAQALKVLEEAAEAYAAWQDWDAGEDFKPCYREDLLDEIADVIQAACNLADALDATDLAPYVATCRIRNEERGRYGNAEEV